VTEAPEEYEWRHGWVPLTMRAALQKTRGDREAAEKLLAARRRRRAGRRREFVSPHPRHAAEYAERQRWASLSDEDLAVRMGDAGEEELTRIVAELDRRDRAERKAERERERRRAKRDARDAERSRAFDVACDAGEDPEAAYARVYGVTEERVRRDEAIASLRSSGYAGKGFRELVRSAHRDHVEQAHADAEDECRGHLLSPAGRAAGVHPRSLFTGPESRARKYASEELLGYWQRNGRLTVEDLAAGLLGGHMRSAGTAAWL
jgi:hypothetical protein